MKKILSLLFLVTIMIFFTTQNVMAGSPTKNFYGYEVKNVNMLEFAASAREAVTSYTGPDNFVPLKEVQNTYIYTGNNCSYYVRIYPASHNTHIYVVSDEEYDVNNNDITNFLKKGGYKYGKLEDSAAMKEYKFDFYKLAREQKLGNFYISPDLVKPLKTGMTKLNDKMAKNNKKTSAIPYSVDTEPINLTCVNTTGYYDIPSKIAVAKKEYRLKEKENKYVHAYEYILTNDNTSTASVTATSTRLAGLKDVTTQAFVDLDRLDMLDTVASFPPVLICTAGTSVLCSVPNWIRLAKITKETTRFAHALPENYQLRQKGRMRILVLKYKDNPQPVNFEIKFAEQSYQFSF